MRQATQMCGQTNDVAPFNYESIGLGLDQLRREAHCGTKVVSNQNQSPTPNGTYPARAITITLGNYCPTWKSGIVSVTWCTATTSTPPNT